MATRSMGVSEARRRLPRLVRTISEEGGRVDVTLRGEPRVSIVRTADLTGERGGQPRLSRPEVLRVEFAVPPGALVDVVRELRSRVGQPRAAGGPSRGGRGRVRRRRK
jgi:hypothetical protein